MKTVAPSRDLKAEMSKGKGYLFPSDVIKSTKIQTWAKGLVLFGDEEVSSF